MRSETSPAALPNEAGDRFAGGDAAAVEWVALSALGPYRLWSETERIIAAAAELRDGAAT